MNERIKELRKSLGLTQEQFAKRLGIKRGAVANYEIGRNNPIDAVVSLICREFNVNESWLRTGEGEMFVQNARIEEVTALIDEFLATESENFRRRFAAALSRLDVDAWEAIEEFSRALVEEQASKEEPPAPAQPSALDDLDIEREVAAYRAELEAQKRGPGRSSASPGAKDA